jgi:protein-L-isoaspartate(D-aspartate) O-methyltransferase
MIDTPHHKKLRKQLVNGIRDKGINDPMVLEAIFNIPRHIFMRPDMEELAYVDKAFPIGEGQTISQPYTVAYQTQLLDVHNNHRVLEIGTGSAYQAVVLAYLAYEVYSIERQRKFFDKNTSFHFLKEFDNLYLFYGDGYEGLPEYAPFDRILITAAAPFIPPKLVMQLKHGGKMVLPLGDDKSQRMVRISKQMDDNIVQEHFDDFVFVPMLPGKKE